MLSAGVVGGTWQVQPCVATTGDGLYEGLDWLFGTGVAVVVSNS